VFVFVFVFVFVRGPRELDPEAERRPLGPVGVVGPVPREVSRGRKDTAAEIGGERHERKPGAWGHRAQYTEPGRAPA
jgi:hypothetical protein